MKRLLFLFLALAGSNLFAQEGTPVKNITGSGPPGGGVAHIVGTEYIDISASPPALYNCTSLSVAGNGTTTCNWTSVSGGTAAASAGMLDPTASPYNVVVDAKTGADGTTVNTQNTLASTNQNCVAADTGKLAIVTNGTTGAYPFGTTLVTVTGCSGNSWTLSTTANASLAGVANWAIGTGNGTGFSTAYLAAMAANKNIYIPCGGMIVETEPFPKAPSGTNFVLGVPDLQGCHATGGSHFILHPNITAAVLANGGPIFADFNSTTATGTLAAAGLGLQVKVRDLFITSLGGLLPGTGGKSYNLINNFNACDGITVQDVGFQAGSLTICGTAGGENHHRFLNFQNFIDNGGGATIIGVGMSGQGQNTIYDSIFAFGGLTFAATCGGGANCSMNNSYIIGTRMGVSAGASSFWNFIGNTCSVSGGGGSQGCLTDNGNASTWYVFGNPLITTTQANFPAVTLSNASSVFDVSGSNLSSQTAGFIVNGTGTINDRAGNTWASTLSQFTGKYVPISGGSMANQTFSAATNFGTNLTAQTLVASAVATSSLSVHLGARQTLAGVGCGAGSNTVFATLSWTAPGGNVQTINTSPTLSISANGAVDSGANVKQDFDITAKIGTAVTYTTTSVLASAGCSPVPQYTIDAAVL